MAQEATRLFLLVDEGIVEDDRRAVARMHPADMKSATLFVGDIIEVTGTRSSGARVIPAAMECRTAGHIALGPLLRQNIACAPGDSVVVKKVECPRALTVSLRRPADSHGSEIVRITEEETPRELLLRPLSVGDLVWLSLRGRSEKEAFFVSRTVPGGMVQVGADTRIVVRPPKVGTPQIAATSFSDIGGLAEETRKILEMVELPLTFPGLFHHLGVGAPKGVLLHGPPGTGKTLIARAVATEADASFFYVSGPEVVHKFYGESEAHLREIFEKAKENAPSVIFLDEIDALAPRRDEVTGEVEKRIVAQLLALLDGIETRGDVVVIAATNMPQLIDPALRRPGRLDREVHIGIPDERDRLEILRIHTRRMPLAADVDLARLAKVTHGFVGADIELLCKEAALASIRRFLQGRGSCRKGHQPDPDKDELATIAVSMADFVHALQGVVASTTREVSTENPNVRWGDIGGLNAAKQALQEAVEWPLRFPELFAHFGIQPPRGILLQGPPGTGKTLLAKALATESAVNFIAVKGPELLSKWVGETERGVREVFRKARLAAPCIVFFDEIDALCSARESQSDVGNRVIGQLLSEMDGISDLSGVLCLGATNRPDLLDPALLRPGRFEVALDLPLPDRPARAEILRIHCKGRPLAEDICVEETAARTEGFSGADLSALCNQASLFSLREFLANLPLVGDGCNPSPAGDGFKELRVTARHFASALSAFKKPTPEIAPFNEVIPSGTR